MAKRTAKKKDATAAGANLQRYPYKSEHGWSYDGDGQVWRCEHCDAVVPLDVVVGYVHPIVRPEWLSYAVSYALEELTRRAQEEGQSG